MNTEIIKIQPGDGPVSEEDGKTESCRRDLLSFGRVP